MTTSRIKELIDEYFDGEIKKSDESILFMSLSNNEEARIYFKNKHILKNVTREMQVEFPVDLDEKIFSNILLYKKESIFQKFLTPAFTYPVMLILLVLSFFFYSQTNIYRKDINRIHVDLQKQNKTIDLLLNSLPATEVKAKFSNEVIIRSN